MRLFLVGMLVLLVNASCLKPAISTRSTNNDEIRVDELFTHDGVRVYRFTDDGRYVYFTSKGDAFSSFVISCGKNCYRRVHLQTLNGER